MANDELKAPPDLATWADVDPGRHPFDPAEVAEALWGTAPPPERADGRRIDEAEVWAWILRVSGALAARFGPWAYRWHWAPVENARGGWVIDRVPEPAGATAFVTRELVSWRRWLEDLADQFGQLTPQLDPARVADPGDLVARWEAAVTQLITGVVARSTAGDDWQGPCSRVLQWFLTANGVPVDEARALTDEAVGGRFSTWAILTTADIARMSERLARAALRAIGVAGRDDTWPDTWPHGWPSWRATNTVT